MTDTDEIVATILGGRRCTLLNISAPEEMLHEYRGMLGVMEAERMLLETTKKNAKVPRSDDAEEPQVIAMNGGTDTSILDRMFGPLGAASRRA